jgi:hypothetical protein
MSRCSHFVVDSCCKARAKDACEFWHLLYHVVDAFPFTRLVVFPSCRDQCSPCAHEQEGRACACSCSCSPRHTCPTACLRHVRAWEVREASPDLVAFMQWEADLSSNSVNIACIKYPPVIVPTKTLSAQSSLCPSIYCSPSRSTRITSVPQPLHMQIRCLMVTNYG